MKLDRSVATQTQVYYFRKANVLDLPFIFNLMVDGSVNGSFSADNLTGKGTIKLFLTLLVNVVPSINRFFRLSQFSVFIFEKEHTELGFLAYSTYQEDQLVVLELCSLQGDHRGNQEGAQMVKHFVDCVPDHSEIIAYSTKYARAMQHILKRMGFSRVKQFVGDQLECYVLHKNGASHLTTPVSGIRNHHFIRMTK